MRVERLRIFVEENKYTTSSPQNKERIRETKKRMDE
jgi:hypothetical protein